MLLCKSQTKNIVVKFLPDKKKYVPLCPKRMLFSNRDMGKSYTASSWQILQGLTAAKVVGCSGAM